MDDTDIKTRKILNMHGGFHPKYSIIKLYTSIRATVQDETAKIQECIRKMGLNDELLSGQHRQG